MITVASLLWFEVFRIKFMIAYFIVLFDRHSLKKRRFHFLVGPELGNTLGFPVETTTTERNLVRFRFHQERLRVEGIESRGLLGVHALRGRADVISWPVWHLIHPDLCLTLSVRRYYATYYAIIAYSVLGVVYKVDVGFVHSLVTVVDTGSGMASVLSVLLVVRLQYEPVVYRLIQNVRIDLVAVEVDRCLLDLLRDGRLLFVERVDVAVFKLVVIVVVIIIEIVIAIVIIS